MREEGIEPSNPYGYRILSSSTHRRLHGGIGHDRRQSGSLSGSEKRRKTDHSPSRQLVLSQNRYSQSQLLFLAKTCCCSKKFIQSFLCLIGAFAKGVFGGKFLNVTQPPSLFGVVMGKPISNSVQYVNVLLTRVGNQARSSCQIDTFPHGDSRKFVFYLRKGLGGCIVESHRQKSGQYTINGYMQDNQSNEAICNIFITETKPRQEWFPVLVFKMLEHHFLNRPYSIFFCRLFLVSGHGAWSQVRTRATHILEHHRLFKFSCQRTGFQIPCSVISAQQPEGFLSTVTVL